MSQEALNAAAANAPQESFPGGGDVAPRADELRVAFEKKPYADMIGHAIEEPEVELCGVLVGQLKRDAYGPWLHVVDSIRGKGATQKAAQVTFTHETWNHIHAEMDKHPEWRILGWYHTHGGFGIFLSEMDTFIHDNFFREPWQFAYVYDPLSGAEGIFFRRGEQLQQAARYWIGGKPRVPRPDPERSEPSQPAGGPAASNPAASQGLQRQLAAIHGELISRPPGGISVLELALGLALLFVALSFTTGGRPAGPERLLVRVLADPRAPGHDLGAELIPLPLSRNDLSALGSGLAVYRDPRGDTYYALPLVPVTPAAVTLDAQVAALRSDLLAASAAAPPPAAPDPAPRAGLANGQDGPQRPDLVVVVLALLVIVSSFVGVGLFVSRRRAR